MFVKYGSVCLLLVVCAAAYTNTHKISRGAPKPVPVIKNAPYIYRGQVFILRETDDTKTPFVAEIVNGGIEMVNQVPKPSPVPPTAPVLDNRIRANDTLPEVLEDPDYFAVIVTPETAALTEISRSTVVEIPLVMLLTGIAKRMPWVLVLKRKNHLEYFRNVEPSLPVVHQLPIIMSQRRRSRSQSALPARTPRLVLESQKYDLVYSEKDKAMLQNICVGVVEELTMLNALVRQFSNDTRIPDEEQYDFADELKEAPAKNESTTRLDSPQASPIEGSVEIYLSKLSSSSSPSSDPGTKKTESFNKGGK